MKERRCFDIAILGGGIAGMTAAVYASRARRSCVVLEKEITGGLANFTYTIENFPSYQNIHGMDLMRKVREQVDALGVVVEETCSIEHLDLSEQHKIIETDEAFYEVKTVIIAVGRTPVLLDVPTPCDQIHYCAICDGAHYKNKHVLIVGSGNSAFDEGIYLQRLGVSHITIIEMKDRIFAAQTLQDILCKYNNVTVKLNCIVKDCIIHNNTLHSVIIENNITNEAYTMQADGIFVFMGQTPNTAPLKGMLAMDTSGYIITDASMRTNVQGVFSAGDVNVKIWRQLTTAAADGTIAALSADQYISGSET